MPKRRRTWTRRIRAEVVGERDNEVQIRITTQSHTQENFATKPEGVRHGFGEYIDKVTDVEIRLRSEQKPDFHRTGLNSCTFYVIGSDGKADREVWVHREMVYPIFLAMAAYNYDGRALVSKREMAELATEYKRAWHHRTSLWEERELEQKTAQKPAQTWLEKLTEEVQVKVPEAPSEAVRLEDPDARSWVPVHNEMCAEAREKVITAVQQKLHKMPECEQHKTPKTFDVIKAFGFYIPRFRCEVC